MELSSPRPGLSGNALKILAALFMLTDHVGFLLYPRVVALRIIGRLAFPIYAFMIAEGCRYTRNKLRYFMHLFVLGAGCQAVYFLFDGSTYLSILITFSLSILLVYALQYWKAHPRSPWAALLFLGGVLEVFVLNQLLDIDYGFWGCMTPVLVSLCDGTDFDRKEIRVGCLGLSLLLLWGAYGGIQQYALLSLPLLLLYSGQRGKWKMKYFFYIFYPAHLVILEGILLLRG